MNNISLIVSSFVIFITTQILFYKTFEERNINIPALGLYVSSFVVFVMSLAYFICDNIIIYITR